MAPPPASISSFLSQDEDEEAKDIFALIWSNSCLRMKWRKGLVHGRTEFQKHIHAQHPTSAFVMNESLHAPTVHSSICFAFTISEHIVNK